MAKRRKKTTVVTTVRQRNPEARLLACPSLRHRVVERKELRKSERARVKQALKLGKMLDGAAHPVWVASSSIDASPDRVI